MSDLLDNLVLQTANNNAFNASQAEINRSWQEYMSGTSHQREVKDLIAAGLNPVLSANSGSSWQAVGNAAADQGAANLAATFLNNQASIEISKINADATKAAAGATAAATMAAAATSAAASRDVANTNYDATVYAANSSKAASEYNTGMSFGGNLISSILGSPITGMLSGGKK